MIWDIAAGVLIAAGIIGVVALGLMFADIAARENHSMGLGLLIAAVGVVAGIGVIWWRLSLVHVG